jgi:phosphate butyryltransferase
MSLKNFETMVQSVKSSPKRRVALAVGKGYDEYDVFARVMKEGTADCVFVGDKAEIEKKAKEVSADISKCEIMHHAGPDSETTLEAAKLVNQGKCDVLMKGRVHTDDFLRSILNKEFGLRTGNLLSHAFIMYPKLMGRFFIATDCAMNVAPTLEQKVSIAKNAIALARGLGLEQPKVAVLAAVEVVNPKMPVTLEAQEMTQMCERGEFGNALVHGPFAFDNAVSEESARIKGIKDPVAGKADVLLMPDLEAGNIMFKTFAYWAEGQLSGLLLGAKKPVVLTSRSDSAETKYLSIVSAIYYDNYNRQNN